MGNETEKTKYGVVIGSKNVSKETLARQMRRAPTPAEARLWYHLRANRLSGLAFRHQEVIDGFIADFYCHAAGLIIEVDGTVHDSQTAYDVERNRILRERGLCILRFTNAQVFNDTPSILATIRAAAQSRLLTPPS